MSVHVKKKKKKILKHLLLRFATQNKANLVSNVSRLALMCYLAPINSACCERGISAFKFIKNLFRQRLSIF